MITNNRFAYWHHTGDIYICISLIATSEKKWGSGERFKLENSALH